MIDYAGKTALVTGAASGIGRALAIALAERGARLILNDVNEAGLAETAGKTGPQTITITADLADPATPQRLIEEGFAKAGRIDLVCSNAGIAHGRRLVREKLEPGGGRLFAINLFAGLRLAQAYAQALERAGGQGRLMFTGSENSLSLPPTVTRMGLGLYAATKHSLLILAEWMREEFAGRTPIDVHILMPGPITTTLSDTVVPDPSAPPMAFIPAARCAELALKGMDLGLFYIPTHAHLVEDMRPRREGVEAAVRALGLA
jgi:NAD(P)-dependent dehydrogenase (short-subunit alcohol dehydrogenase family)